MRLHASRQMLEPAEAAMMSGALSYKDKPVRARCDLGCACCWLVLLHCSSSSPTLIPPLPQIKAVMTPVDKVFAVLAGDRLDYALISRIFRTGYSRIPVWEDERRRAVVGMLYAKDLMVRLSARVPAGEAASHM